MMVLPGNPNADSSSQRPNDEIASALNLLNRLISRPDQRELLDPDQRATSKMVYTHGVTLWMLTLQRLGGGHSLTEVVSEAISRGHELFPDNKRVRENTVIRSGR